MGKRIQDVKRRLKIDQQAQNPILVTTVSLEPGIQPKTKC